MLIKDVHEAIFDFLIEKNIEDSDFRFTTRQNNRNNRLTLGYWFIGDDNYLEVSFWDGKEGISRINKIGYTVDLKRNKVYYNFSTKSDLGKEIVDLAIKKLSTPKVEKYFWKTILVENIISIDQILDSLKNFLFDVKPVIDEIVLENLQNGISFIPDEKFKKQIEKISKIKNN